MKAYYFPGCSLKGTAKEYGESVEAAAKSLDIELEELPDWTCCGASSAHVSNDTLATSLAGRNMIIADKLGSDLVVPCAACFQRLKAADKKLRTGEKIEGIDHEYRGASRIVHSANFFRDTIDEKKIVSKVKKPLTDLNIVCYYGCLTSRPPAITDAVDAEDPQAMDDLMKSLGATVKTWSYKTDCCGGNLILTHQDKAYKLIQKLFDTAIEAGADCIVAGCPMCQANLDMWQDQISKESGQKYAIPIFYFTELMELAFGNPASKKWIGKHITDPKPLLQRKGLL